jgi:hypothetical protein
MQIYLSAMNNQLRAEAAQAFTDLSQPCQTALAGVGINLSQIAALASSTQYFLTLAEGNLTVSSVSGYPVRRTTISQYVGNNAAAVVQGPTRNNENMIIINTDVFSKLTLAQQETVLVHELLHIGLDEGDIALAQSLGLGEFKTRDSASLAISNYLGNNCNLVAGTQ